MSRCSRGRKDQENENWRSEESELKNKQPAEDPTDV